MRNALEIGPIPVGKVQGADYGYVYRHLRSSLDNTATPWAPFTGVSIAGVLCLTTLGVLLVNDLLGFNSHMHYIWCVAAELGVCILSLA